MPRKPKPNALTREAALQARPVRFDGVAREELPEGGLRITTQMARPKWHRFLGGKGTMQRKIELDYLGAEVYGACDGGTTVKALVREFAANHQLSVPEAELSVTKFLNLMMGRGLIVMDMKPQE